MQHQTKAKPCAHSLFPHFSDGRFGRLERYYSEDEPMENLVSRNRKTACGVRNPAYCECAVSDSVSFIRHFSSLFFYSQISSLLCQ